SPTANRPGATASRASSCPPPSCGSSPTRGRTPSRRVSVSRACTSGSRTTSRCSRAGAGRTKRSRSARWTVAEHSARALRGALATAVLLFGLTAPAAADCTSAENERLQVVTLNTWGLPPPLAPDRSGRLPLIEQRLREAAHDLVALQEV